MNNRNSAFAQFFNHLILHFYATLCPSLCLVFTECLAPRNDWSFLFLFTQSKIVISSVMYRKVDSALSVFSSNFGLLFWEALALATLSVLGLFHLVEGLGICGERVERGNSCEYLDQ